MEIGILLLFVHVFDISALPTMLDNDFALDFLLFFFYIHYYF